MIPVESNEILEFTPKSLINVPDAPVFRLRAPDERHMRRYNALVKDNNLEGFSEAAFNAEKERGILKLWGDEAQPVLDRFRTNIEMRKQNIDVSQADIDWLTELDERLFEFYTDEIGTKILAVMRRKTQDYWEYSPRYAIATMVCGWKSFDVPYRMESGYMKPEDVRLIDRGLINLEKQAIEDKVDGIIGPGVAFIELWTACLNRTRLTEDEEKNSPAPSPVSSNQEDSTQETNGASTEASGTDENITTSSAPATSAKKKTPASSEATPEI